MTRAALIGAVGLNAQHFAGQTFDLVVAVDGGYLSCTEHGIDPDIVLGDFDSLGYVPEGLDVQEHPSIKDESDMELALRLARERGIKEVFLYGALGARLDHTLANLQLMSGHARQGMRIVAIADDYAVVALSGGAGRVSQMRFEAFDPSKLGGSQGRYLSLLAVGGDALGVTEQGFKYELVGARLSCTVSRGLSNEFTGEPAHIAVEQGTLLVVFALDAWPCLVGPMP